MSGDNLQKYSLGKVPDNTQLTDREHCATSPSSETVTSLSSNGSQLKNPDISGALYTLRIQY